MLVKLLEKNCSFKNFVYSKRRGGDSVDWTKWVREINVTKNIAWADFYR